MAPSVQAGSRPAFLIWSRERRAFARHFRSVAGQAGISWGSVTKLDRALTNRWRERQFMARSRYTVSLVFLTFFVISLLTNILGPIVPDIINSFHVSLTAAGFLAFAFFIAYGVMSIPAGFLVERFTEKPVMILAFLVGALGSLSFALFPQYRVAIVSLFVMGAGMATLQVAVNPLLRVAGGEEHYAFNSTLAQLVFGSASFISPRFYFYRGSRAFITQTKKALDRGRCIAAWRAREWSGCTLSPCSPTLAASKVRRTGSQNFFTSTMVSILTPRAQPLFPGFGGC